LFRNGGGLSPDFPGHQGTCRPNASGPKRRKSGKNCGSNYWGGTAAAANCPILTPELAEKLWLIT
jgi:hypothetical protein